MYIYLILLFIVDTIRGDVLPRSDLIKAMTFSGCHENVASMMVDLASDAMTNWSVERSPFVGALDQFAISKTFSELLDVNVHSFGGYPQAERRCLFFERAMDNFDGTYEEDTESEALTSAMRTHVGAVSIEGNFAFDTASHDDFDAAIRAVCGPKASAYIGDIIILGEKGAQLIVDADALSAIVGRLTQIKTVPVSVHPLKDLSELCVTPLRVKQTTTIEASARLDAVASAGFGLSRSKVGKLVKNGQVLVDWRPQKSASYGLKEGQIVYIRGSGRLLLGPCSTTAKGRVKIPLTRTW